MRRVRGEWHIKAHLRHTGIPQNSTTTGKVVPLDKHVDMVAGWVAEAPAIPRWEARHEPAVTIPR